jgi:hypothetical protein
VPETLSLQVVGPDDADTVGKPVFPLLLLRIRGRTFRHSVGILPPLPATDETNTEHGASPSERLCVKVRLVCYEPFVSVAAVMEADADASDLVGLLGSTCEVMVAGDAGWSIPPPEALTAASILARTFLARRVRFTSGKSIVAPVVRRRELAVGPSASSNATHARAKPLKISPATAFAHSQSETPRAAPTTAGTINRHSHQRLGHTITYSRSRK